ncbi:dimethylsulfonioproprionate lyase family protein [Octadecabacter ascidiaceicola]|uniref:Cupin domain protein n=1 Tax=Octadecabacter ascidiaceicola TaxID=1655543 RepID=A0A238K8B2_9RHOB|nr:dimethylsulfonioproprionate lyase family protein [Octadecabacter ascidiaceicola]SMX39089.1 Cupin domain protein [Octadecabacter ascidiaceicola]
MHGHTWNDLLAEVQSLHETSPSLQSFCPFPNDAAAQDVTPFHIVSTDLLQREEGLVSDRYGPLRDAFIAAAPHAQWRETYKDTDIGQDFLDRFGCYCLIGDGGAFTSESMRAYMVYMPAGLHYPWHDHVAEEIYFVVAGEAEFHRHGEASETLTAGDTSFHASSQPHAMTTHDHPVLALVLWRNGFDSGPKLTP